MIVLKNKSDINNLKKSCSAAALILNILEKEICEGITTEYLNLLAEKLCKEFKCIPAFKNYKGFPYSLCASCNNEIVHGFPNNKKLKSGDILSLDFGVIINGWYSDTALTKSIGYVDSNKSNLIRTTEKCLYGGIDTVGKSKRLNSVGNYINNTADKNNFKVLKDYTGHGLGLDLHELPFVNNFRSREKGILLKPGMVLAIEPILGYNIKSIHTHKNNWTDCSNKDGSAAHFEHTIVLLSDGVEILTDRSNL